MYVYVYLHTHIEQEEKKENLWNQQKKIYLNNLMKINIHKWY